jgi:hypothetical protein
LFNQSNVHKVFMPNTVFPADLVVEARRLILAISGNQVPRVVAADAVQATTFLERLQSLFRSTDSFVSQLRQNSRTATPRTKSDLFEVARDFKAKLNAAPTITQLITDLGPVVEKYATGQFPEPEARLTESDVTAELENLQRCDSFTDIYLYKHGQAADVPSKIVSRLEPGHIYLSVKTPPITLRHDGRVVPLNEFYVTIDLNKLPALVSGDVGIVRITAHNPNYPENDTSHPHPHVSGSGLCFGEGKSACLTALARGSFVDAFEIILAILSNYNGSSPYAGIENWASNACAGCGVALTDTIMTVRHDNGSTKKYCPNCAFKCAKSNNFYTNRNKYTCENCRNTVHVSHKVVIPAGTHNPQTICCAVCADEVQARIARAAQEAAANAPTYTCHSCNAVTERTSLPEGHAWPPVVTCIDQRIACVKCGVATKLVGVPAVVCRAHGPDFTVAPDNSYLAVKHYATGNMIRIAISNVRCDCGNDVLPHLRRHDPFTDKFICLHCDPRNTGVSPLIYTDINAMRQWIMHEMSTRIPEYFDTLDFSSMYSLDLAHTHAVVNRLLGLRGRNVSDDVSVFIDEVNQFSGSNQVFVTSLV